MQLSGRWSLAAASLALAAVAGAAPRPPADWRLWPGGFGPFKVGMPFAQAQKLVPGLTATPGSLRASSNCDQVALPGHPGVALMFIGGELARIDLFRPGPQTAHGVGPGSRVAQAMRAYPDMRVEPRAYEENERFLTERSGDNAIRFETAKGRIENVYAGRWPQVQYSEGCL